MIEKYQVRWKNYYGVLQVVPNAEPSLIGAAYRRLTDLYDPITPEMAEKSRSFSDRMAEIEEANDVLSDPVRRDAYDQEFITNFESRRPEADRSTHGYVVDSMALTVRDVSKYRLRKTFRWWRWGKSARRAVLLAVATLAFIGMGGTSVAFAKPDHTLAAPFKGTAINITEAARTPMALIMWVRGAVAAYERNILSTALQSMRLEEALGTVPRVNVSTSDMANFPSPEHPLYPDYLDKQFSQFKYTVSRAGIIRVDTSGATTDALLEKVDHLFERLQ